MPPPQPVGPKDLEKHPLFDGVAPAFLQWNAGSVVRRHFKKGDIICREGQFGSTAFYIEKGTVEIFINSPIKHVKSNKGHGSKTGWGPFGLIQKFTSSLVGRASDPRDEESTRRSIPIDAPVALDTERPQATLQAGDLFGEMTCMSHYPRSATVRAAEDVVVLELLRNVLYILQRNKKSRAVLDAKYRERAVANHLRGVRVFADLLKEPAEFDRFVGTRGRARRNDRAAARAERGVHDRLQVRRHRQRGVVHAGEREPDRRPGEGGGRALDRRRNRDHAAGSGARGSRRRPRQEARDR